MAKRGKSHDASPHVYFYYISRDLELLESIGETVMQQSFLWDRLLVSVEPSVPSSYQLPAFAVCCVLLHRSQCCRSTSGKSMGSSEQRIKSEVVHCGQPGGFVDPSSKV